ncbi:MAG: hypothetical protein FWB86_11355 [Treponema sp.]|nr:hypothetical protein [Treponema sp.]MCL2252152.1 hypothetical protein [Treponema sp.]
MKKKVFAGIVILALVFGVLLVGCDDGKNDNNNNDTYSQYYDPTFRGNNNGTVEVINPTSHKMLLFRRGALLDSNIIGGVHPSDTAQVSFSDRSDFTVGGYEIIYAIKQSEYESKKGNSEIDYSAMITYRNNSRFRITLKSRYDGNYVFQCFNRSEDWPMEIRKNGPDGEKIAFLARREAYHKVYATSTELFVAHPVWVAYNQITRAITTFTPEGEDINGGVQNIQPQSSATMADYYFPSGGTATINFDVDIPFATIAITNNCTMSAQSVVFRNGGTRYTPESNIQLIDAGRRAAFETRSDGTGLNLNLALGSMQSIVIPVRFEDDPSVFPVIENGWYYTVALNFKPDSDANNPNSYTAWLVKEQSISKTQFLSAN